MVVVTHLFRSPSPSSLQLANEKALNLSTVRHFVIDECDKVLEKLGECLGMSLPQSTVQYRRKTAPKLHHVSHLA